MTNTTQSAVLKPWVRPYQGTSTTAAAKVSANISRLAQRMGACGSLSEDAVMSRVDSSGDGGAPAFDGPVTGPRERAKGRSNLACLGVGCEAASAFLRPWPSLRTRFSDR